MSQPETFPRDRGPGAWATLLKNVRLGWRLLHDPMIPTWNKLILLGAVLYVVLPADLVPDIFLGLGQLDDLGVLVLGLRTFISTCPQQVVQRHLAAMAAVEGSSRIVKDEPSSPPAGGYLEDGAASPAGKAPPVTVEGTARPTDQRS